MDTRKILTGRFFKKPLMDFLAALNLAAVESRRLTQSERAILKVEYSREHDFKPGFAPRSHGLDAHSLAGRELAKLETAKLEDLKQAELAMIRAQLAAAEKYVSQLTIRLSELDAERGSTVYLERQREIRLAMAKAG